MLQRNIQRHICSSFHHAVIDEVPVAEQQAGCTGGGLWQAQCTLLLWLSQLLYIPFSLASVDSSLDSTASQPGCAEVLRMLNLCQAA